MRAIILTSILILWMAFTGSAAERSAVIETQAAGELEALLGDRLLTVEELTVRGPVNAADFQTMRHAAYYERLRDLNLTDAIIEGKKIPNNAFNKDKYYGASTVMLRRVALPDDVEEIGAGAFGSAILLEYVKLPKMLKRIGNASFAGCYNLEFSPEAFPAGLTEIGDSAFYACGRLNDLTLPVSLKKIGDEAFASSGLARITINDGCRVEIGNRAFMNCGNLKEAALPSTIGRLGTEVFYGDYNISGLNLPVTTPYVAFQNLALREVAIPASSVGISPNAFCLCRSMESVDLPEGLSRIFEYAFQACGRIEVMVLPSTLTEIWQNSLCLPGLKRLYCKAATPPEYIVGVPDELPFTGIGRHRELDTPKDIPVYVPVGSADKYRSAPGWNYFTNYIEVSDFPSKSSVADMVTDVIDFREVHMRSAGELTALLGDDLRYIKSLKIRGSVNGTDFETMWNAAFYGRLEELDLSEADIEGRKIPDRAFWHDSEMHLGAYCPTWLQRVVLPDNIEEIGEMAFRNAWYLREINVPKSLKRIGTRAFSQCESLESQIVLPEGIEDIPSGTFDNCSKLNSVVLPNSLKRIGDDAFASTGLSHIVLPDGLDVISANAFSGCTRLESVFVPNSVRELGSNAFASNRNLKTLRLPESIRHIPNNIAIGCKSLIEVSIPASVETVGMSAFNSCSSLETVMLSDRLMGISRSAFSGCVRIKELIIPAGCNSLSDRSFSQMAGLERIYSKASNPPYCVIYEYKGSSIGPFENLIGPHFSLVDSTPDDTPRDTPVYVPRGSAEAYRNAPGWNYFTNFIETDEFSEAGIEEAYEPETAVEIRAEAGRIILAGKEDMPSDYAVYTSDGRLVAAGRVSGSEASVNVAPGLYLVRCGSNSTKLAIR